MAKRVFVKETFGYLSKIHLSPLWSKSKTGKNREKEAYQPFLPNLPDCIVSLLGLFFYFVHDHPAWIWSSHRNGTRSGQGIYRQRLAPAIQRRQVFFKSTFMLLIFDKLIHLINSRMMNQDGFFAIF
jgi:hypothetical protein